MARIRKSALGELEGAEGAAVGLARDEWTKEVGFEPTYGDVEYEEGADVYTVTFGYEGWSTGSVRIRPYRPREPPLDPLPAEPRLPSVMPMEWMSARGAFEVKAGDIKRQKIRIETRQKWPGILY